MNTKELKAGAIFSYLLIIANTLYALIFTPFLISALGDGEYGVYKIIGSLTSSITILDLGIGSTMLRYIAKFRAEKDEKNLSNFSAMGFIQAAVLSGIMVVVCIILYFFIDSLYDQSLTPAELGQAKRLFILFIIILVFNTFEKVVFSIISGCEHYIFANALKLVTLILKVLLAFAILSRFANSVFLLVIEIGLLFLVITIQLIYIKVKIKIKIHYYFWDGKLFKQSFHYTILMFIQSIAVQFNGNLDNIVIGAVEGAAIVAVYSIGLQLYGMYEQFALTFSDLMLPTVSRQIAQGATTQQLEDTVIKVGRLEFIALGGALCGYILIGKEFIELWLGASYAPAWIVGLILMIPTTIPLIQNVCLSILRAKNKMGFRTIAVCSMAIFNLLITIIGVKYYGFMAACIGTAIGLIGANIIAMNIYYVKVIKLNIGRIFKGILSHTWLCCLVASFGLWMADRFIGGNWGLWIIKVLIFLSIYGIMLFLYGFNKSEKNMLGGKFYRLIKRR